jgi:Secretion system C-terminal sorting domain
MKRYFLRTSAGLALCLFLSYNAATAQTCTGSAALGSASGANNNVIGSLAWSGVGNTVAQDGSYATAAPLLALLSTIPTHYLQITGFSFVIPSSYTMCGITATISKGQTSLLTVGTVTDNSVVLVKNGVPVTGAGANHALTGNWNYGSVATSNYGSATDGWGTTWLNSDISNNPNFGIAISANINDVLGVVPVAAIDQVTMTVYSSPPLSLAIDLVNFTAQGASSGNVLNWTANTTGVAGSFIIQRSANGTDWQDMTTIFAEIGQDSYSYTDATPLTGQNFYRIQVLNTDGSVEGYSIVATVATKSLATVRTWPNPFTDMINITSPNNFSRVILRDALGRTLQVREYGSGVNNAQLNAASLPAGLYFVQVDAAIYKLIKN